jgi:hypothetical protein
MRWTLLNFDRKSDIPVVKEKNIGPVTLFFFFFFFGKPPALD